MDLAEVVKPLVLESFFVYGKFQGWWENFQIVRNISGMSLRRGSKWCLKFPDILTEFQWKVVIFTNFLLKVFCGGWTTFKSFSLCNLEMSFSSECCKNKDYNELQRPPNIVLGIMKLSFQQWKIPKKVKTGNQNKWKWTEVIKVI